MHASARPPGYYLYLANLHIHRILASSDSITRRVAVFILENESDFSFPAFETFFVRKWQIRKFLGSFRYHKSANFLGVPVRKSQIRKFLRCASPQIAHPQISTKYCKTLCLKTVLKVVFCKKKMYAEVLGPQIAKKDWVRKSQIRKVPRLRLVRKSNKLYKSAHLRICDLRFLFADAQLCSQ
jgi:hypothetical protein